MEVLSRGVEEQRRGREPEAVEGSVDLGIATSARLVPSSIASLGHVHPTTAGAGRGSPRSAFQYRRPGPGGAGAGPLNCDPVGRPGEGRKKGEERRREEPGWSPAVPGGFGPFRV